MPILRGDRVGVICLAAVVTLGSCFAQEHDSTAHDHHMADVHRHGAEAMGFDQQKTEHHFQLSKDGGVVEVSARNADDKTSIEQIRTHLKMQAEKFSQGDFAAPEHTHGRVPPGTDVMKQMSSEIKYAYEAKPQGGVLRITSSSAKAIDAIHDFLRFQIQDHETGDSLAVR
jgi:hypothetical protein